jgi:hypothetical protein
VVKIIHALQPIETVPTEQIINSSNSNSDDYEGVEEITVEIGEEFDSWYEYYLLKQKSGISEMTYLNLLRLFDTMLAIKENYY